MAWEHRDWVLFGNLFKMGAPVAVAIGAGLALMQPQPTPITSQPPPPAIIVIETTTETETVMPRHARPEVPSSIAPTSRFAPETPAVTMLPELPNSVVHGSSPTTTPEVMTTPTSEPIPEVTETSEIEETSEPTTTVESTPSFSETPIYDSLVQEFIGQDPSFSVH
jgi:hypothetical protein